MSNRPRRQLQPTPINVTATATLGGHFVVVLRWVVVIAVLLLRKSDKNRAVDYATIRPATQAAPRPADRAGGGVFSRRPVRKTV